MAVEVRAQPKPPMASPPASMMRLRQVGSFWLRTGTPQGEPEVAGVGAAEGVGEGSVGEAEGVGGAKRARWPVAESTPGMMPTLSLAVQQRAAAWPLAKLSRGRSEIFWGERKPS